jgi:hypothetical protein
MSRYEQKENVSLDGLLALIDAAQEELSALCKGKKFRMTIPVEHDDSDMVIGDALRHAQAFVRAVKANRGQNERPA